MAVKVISTGREARCAGRRDTGGVCNRLLFLVSWPEACHLNKPVRLTARCGRCGQTSLLTLDFRERTIESSPIEG